VALYPGPEILDGKIRIRDKHPGSATLVGAVLEIFSTGRLFGMTGYSTEFERRVADHLDGYFIK
jgi:hypothetical protein